MNRFDIIKNKYYSLCDVQKITGIKTRTTLAKYADEGILKAIISGKKGTSKRYAIRGKWLELFLLKLDTGSLEIEKNSKKELLICIKVVLDFCETKRITQLIKLKKFYEKNHQTSRD
jgi:hypothetical protein